MKVSYLMFKLPPFKHQLEALERTKNNIYSAFLCEMGTGKSAMCIATAAHLFKEKKINGFLIVAPKTICRNWSEKEIPTHLHDDIKRKIVVWRSPCRALEKEIMSMYHNISDILNIFIVNIETVAGLKCYDEIERFLKHKNVLFVIDESTTIKNPKADRTKACIKLSKLAKYRRIMTGTPITQSPMDLYSQFEFLQPSALGSKSFYGFRNQYAVLSRRYVNGRSFDEVIGYQRLDELKKIIEPISYRVLKKDCLDLPEKIYEIRYVEPSLEQRRIYELLKDETMAMLTNGNLVLAPLIITQILRLRQVLCNLTSAEGVEQSIDEKYPRIDEIMKILEECGDQKVIIWASFLRTIEIIRFSIADKYGIDSVATISGAIKNDIRTEVVNKFQTGNLRFIVAQPRTGGYGLTLTAATTVIYHDNDWSLEVRQQSEDRCHRIGQNNKVTYIDLVASGTIDEKIRSALVVKKELADIVNGDNIKNLLSN